MKRLGCLVTAVFLFFSMLPGQAGAVELNIDSKSAVLMEVSTGTILYKQNAHEALSPASVTKVMTMLLSWRLSTPEKSAGTTWSLLRNPPLPKGAVRSI